MDFLLCLVLIILSYIIIYKETITFLEQCGIKTKTWVKYLGTPTIVKMGDSFGNLCAIQFIISIIIVQFKIMEF